MSSTDANRIIELLEQVEAMRAVVTAARSLRALELLRSTIELTDGYEWDRAALARARAALDAALDALETTMTEEPIAADVEAWAAATTLLLAAAVEIDARGEPKLIESIVRARIADAIRLACRRILAAAKRKGAK